MDQDDPTTLYGPATKQAVAYFQRKNGLQQDGIASVQTQTLLFSADAKAYSVSEGDSGPDVQTIQDRLVELGYAVDHTGYFGTDTTKAVKYFQRMNSLSPDGNVGSNTSEILYSTKAEPSVEYTKAKEAAKAAAEAAAQASAAASASASKPSSSPGSTPKPSASASSTPKPSASTSPAKTDSKVEAFISAALSELGKTYVLGGKGPDVFDCSGLVYYSLKASGNGIAYMTSYGWGDAEQYTRISSMKDLKRGDVVCETGHVGIYLGDGKIVNASSSNGKVIISENVFSSNYWTSKFVCGRRVF
jgi:peptidoglycan DL-endopeptidase CwlO